MFSLPVNHVVSVFPQVYMAADRPHKPILAEHFKTKMCQNYEKQGSCPYEARCMFAHGYHDLRTKEMNLADNLVTEEAIKAFLARQRISAQVDICGEKCSILAERFKTKMCQNFEQTGVCPYEHKCMFAHGLEDLRTKEMNLDDGLTTEEAIRDFQHHAATAARDAQRRKKRNEKKKAKAKAVKFARRQELACSKSTTEFIATESGDFASGSASNVDFASFQASPNVQPTSGSDSGRSEAGTELPSAAASPLRVKGDQYRHDPYSPVVIGLPVASRSAVGNLQLPRARQQVEEPVTSQVPPKAVPAAAQPALQSQQRLLRATSALFPLASVLQQIRRQRRATTTDEVDPATTTSIRAPTPGAQAHTILLP